MKILSLLLKSFLYTVIVLSISVLGLFTYDAFDYYIIKTMTQEDVRQNEIGLFLFCLENQSSVTRFQASQIQRLTIEKQEIVDRAIDLQIENLELRKAIKRSVDVIDRLIGQIEGYKRHLIPDDGIFEPAVNKEA